MGYIRLNNLIATTVSETAPTLNQNSSLKLGIRDYTNRDANAYLYFNRPFPLKATIISAKLVFYTYIEGGTGTHGFKFTRLGAKFTDSTVVYNNRPTTFIAGDKILQAPFPWADKLKWELDIKDWMQSVSNGGTWYGFRIVPTVFEDAALWIYSEIYTDLALRPYVEITWADNPNTPQGLAPSAGRAVGINKPVVKANYIDVSGNTTLNAVRVQINSTNVWTAPSYDSTWVLASVPELDLSRSDLPVLYSGIPVDTTVFWRIAFRDAAGLESPFSAATSMKYDTHGVLTLNNPPSGTPKVEDNTPPIAWDFTGETQAAYQIQIYHVVNGVRVIDWDTGKVTSTLSTITVPSGKINEPTNTTYTITVKVWDTKARESVANSDAHVQVVRDFTFIPGATTGTTGLTAVPATDGRPKVTLTWQAATFPDRFNILRNSGAGYRVIAAALDPNDTFVSGTTHTYVDKTPHPGRSLSYQVQRVVNNVASATNTTVTNVKVNSIGIWLQDPVTGLELFIEGDDDRPFEFADIGTTLQSIAPDSAPVEINQTLGGLVGTLSGQLISYYNTAEVWRDNYFKIRNMRVKQFYLTSGDYTFKVTLDQFTYEQRTIPEKVYKISFRFHQQDHVSNPITG